jgi:hypothetical protein
MSDIHSGDDICSKCLMACFTYGMRSRCCDAPTLNSALRMFNAIEELRKNEGAVVTIPCDPPDFGAGPMFVTVVDDWTGWEEKEITSASVLDALEAAVKEKLSKALAS